MGPRVKPEDDDLVRLNFTYLTVPPIEWTWNLIGIWYMQLFFVLKQ
jgi:hypothetical protein